MTNVTVPPTDVLRNRGFQIRVHRLKKDAQGQYVYPYVRELNEATNEPIFEHSWLKFTNASLAAMEDDEPYGFGSLDNWQELLQRRSFRVISKTLAIVLDEWTTDGQGNTVPNIRLAATLLVDGAIYEYMITMMQAFLLAQGASPESVGESASRMLRKYRETMEEANRKVEETDVLEDASGIQISLNDDSPSPSGTQDGALSEDAVMTSSGR